MLSDVISLLKRSNNVAIYSHINTDCDAMGSSLGLKLALEKLNKKVDVYSNSNFPSNFSFYGNLDFINQKSCDKYDLVICLDTPNENRLGKYKYTYRKGVKNILVIDHHFLANEKFGSENYVLESSSTAEILVQVIDALGVKFDEYMCKFLMSGILTDTGRFSHSVTPKTLKAVSRLLSYSKINIEDITNPLFNSMQYSQFELLKKLYQKIEFLCDKKFAIVMLTRQDFVDAGASLDDTDALPDLPLQLETVKFSILASEDDKGYFRVSLRSKGNFSAREVAESFGGGGHLNASGCKIFGELDEVKQKLIDSTLSCLGWKND